MSIPFASRLSLSTRRVSRLALACTALAGAALAGAAGCGGSTAARSNSSTAQQAAHARRGPVQGLAGDRVPHGDPRAYAAMLDSPRRAQWQQPERVVGALGIAPGARVADVGTGSGYFLPYLARAVGPSGHVTAEDIDPDLLAIARERVTREGLTQVELRQGTASDPGLEPGAYDWVLLVDTYHHVQDRRAFLASVARALAPGRGRFVLIDFRDGDLPEGPRPGHKLPRAQVDQELAAAGFTVQQEYTFLPYQFVLVLVPPAAPGATAATTAQ